MSKKNRRNQNADRPAKKKRVVIPFVERPFEGLPHESERVAMREMLPLATIPVRTTEEFGGADPAVLVGVDEVERAGVEADAAGGAGEDDPELLVEFGEPGDILARADAHLVEPASAEKAPAVAVFLEGQSELHANIPRAGECF